MNNYLKIPLYIVLQLLLLMLESVIGLPFLSIWLFVYLSQSFSKLGIGSSFVFISLCMSALFSSSLVVVCVVLAGLFVILDLIKTRSLSAGKTRTQLRQALGSFISAGIISIYTGVGMTPVLVVYLLSISIVITWLTIKANTSLFKKW